MPSARHRASARTRARSSIRRLLTPAALATTVTTGVVVAGIGAAGAAAVSGSSSDLSEAGAPAMSRVSVGALADRADSADRVNRSGGRHARTARGVTLEPQAVRHAFATADLNVWSGPREQAPKIGLVDSGTKLSLTGQKDGNWAEVLVKQDRVRWVNASYLAAKKPRPEKSGSSAATSGISSAPCADGSATESGLQSNAVVLFRAVCAAFPQLSSYGGYDPHGEHIDGRAIDFMISDSATGQAVADWVLANASALGVRDIIWSQHIWTPDQASAGWRYMEDRGSTTANHYDHVHVAVY